MVNENDIIKLLQANYIQLRQQQAQLVKLTEAVGSLTYNANKYSQILPFGVKNIRTEQILDVRRHIVGGANRTLISAITSLRSCGIGTCRRLSSG